MMLSHNYETSITLEEQLYSNKTKPMESLIELDLIR